SVGEIVSREYFDAATGERVDAALRRAAAAGRYDGATTADALASALSHDLYDATHDKHLVVEVVRERAAGPSATQAERDEARARFVRAANYGVRKIEILPGNIGFLDLSSFFRPEEARDAIATAMHLVRHADALIIDMRANGGGSPGTVALLVSYLLD